MWLRFFVVQFFHKLLWVLGGRLTVTGIENLPADGAYLVVTNHMSIADSPIMLMALPPQQITHFWIADKWKTLPVFGYWASQLGGIFIKKDIVDRRAIREAVNLLKAGEIVGLAPEATRSTIGQIIKPRNGAAYLAKQVDIPIVPVAIIGTESLFANFLRLRRTQVEIWFGEPFRRPQVEGRFRQRHLEALTSYIMLKIAALLPERYHGYYAFVSHPGLMAMQAGEDMWTACLAFEGL